LSKNGENPAGSGERLPRWRGLLRKPPWFWCRSSHGRGIGVSDGDHWANVMKKAAESYWS